MSAGRGRAAPRRGLAQALWKRRHFLLLVVLPTLIAAIYLYGFAAGQYVSEARFVVRGQQEGRASASLGQVLGAAAGFKQVPEEAMTVRDYLGSYDAIAALKERIGLLEIYRRPEADFLARLWDPDMPAEFLQIYYNHMNDVQVDNTGGITTIRARAFRPEDAQRIAEEQLRLSEEFVNQLSSRARESSLATAQSELERAEQRVVAAQDAITAWRQREQAVDPATLAQINQAGFAALDKELNTARTELQEKQAFMRSDNPQIATLRNRIQALETRIRVERDRLSNGDEALPERIAVFERLAQEREFANRQLASATASLETARIDAQRQQLFLSRVVQPNLAEYPLYPRSFIFLISLFAVLTMLYGVGWLLIAGVREHAL
ncbi:capsule biosynthesis protein [Roseomonas marmotae]|uniref:Capsule biosynthesis protein n=1 Tax=Roseomonas marmotae TaxID=2768161 RepID=A0ABS3KI64_9PROT|nr:capsule biosynthesis protein [Roseomonas marmotae]MBO1076011.1 capsule biosynthesis protein [Roseomonas marmotae]QTI80142.1 capsule biosynthesis protein [Roseomonas marmotae]